VGLIVGVLLDLDDQRRDGGSGPLGLAVQAHAGREVGSPVRTDDRLVWTATTADPTTRVTSRSPQVKAASRRASSSSEYTSANAAALHLARR
jgi:hypothetical protein